MHLNIPQQEDHFDPSIFNSNAGCVSILDIDLSQPPTLADGTVVDSCAKVLDSPRTLEAMAA